MKYYLIAGEASGDLHGSKLIKEIKNIDMHANIRCWGGNLMKKAGGTLVKDYKELAFMGFIEVLRHLKTILKNLKFCKKDIEKFNPDVIVYIDYPGFNLRIAKWAKKRGYKNHYYISPQIWAWNENRISIIKKNIDSMYVILPFEEDYYKRKHDFKVYFVGHPLIENFKKEKVSSNFFNKNKISKKKPLIAILPGSRKQEIKRMVKTLIETSKKFLEFQFVLAAAPGIDINWYKKYIDNTDIIIVKNQTYDLLKASEAAIVSSGTATLETAIIGVPQVVCYKTNFFTYQIAKRLVKLKFISLVNLILNKKIVEELIQKKFTTNNLSIALEKILIEKNQNTIKKEYRKIISKLGAKSASRTTARLIVSSIK